MRANIVRWLYRREEVECECGFERIGLAFGFVGDLVAGRMPLVLEVALGLKDD